MVPDSIVASQLLMAMSWNNSRSSRKKAEVLLARHAMLGRKEPKGAICSSFGCPLFKIIKSRLRQFYEWTKMRLKWSLSLSPCSSIPNDLMSLVFFLFFSLKKTILIFYSDHHLTNGQYCHVKMFLYRYINVWVSVCVTKMQWLLK